MSSEVFKMGALVQICPMWTALPLACDAPLYRVVGDTGDRILIERLQKQDGAYEPVNGSLFGEEVLTL